MCVCVCEQLAQELSESARAGVEPMIQQPDSESDIEHSTPNKQKLYSVSTSFFTDLTDDLADCQEPGSAPEPYAWQLSMSTF